MELQVQQLLQAHHYNTVGNFVRLYQEFCRSQEPKLETFFRSYNPPITAEHHTCVGLGLELLRRLRTLDSRFPGLASRLYLVSCEESIEESDRYMADQEPPTLLAEKEHVLVALQLAVAGRTGVLLLDPGYHVARVITVMADLQYPHTGWFTQTDEIHVTKEYNYVLAGEGHYVSWNVQETRRGMQRLHTSLVYVACPFLGAVQCTERRNLVYDFKSLLARDTKGHLLAGLYFSLPPTPGHAVTLFSHAGGDERSTRRKVPFAAFLQPQVSSSILEAVRECGEQLGMTCRDLLGLLSDLANIVTDYGFVEQVLRINDKINLIASEN